MSDGTAPAMILENFPATSPWDSSIGDVATNSVPEVVAMPVVMLRSATQAATRKARRSTDSNGRELDEYEDFSFFCAFRIESTCFFAKTVRDQV